MAAPAAPRKILIAIDGSPQADFAFEWYFTNLHFAGNFVIMVYCIDVPVSTAIHSSYAFKEVDQLLSKQKEKAEVVKAKYLGKLKLHKTRGDFKILIGFSAGELLVEAGHTDGVSAVVMGTRGLGRVRQTVMGSVSSYLLHHAHCAVVVAKQYKGRDGMLRL
eukprot:GHVU01218103.1.p1 GENE.GHVU01218103.1~~GHVU01218103.1.p1  ORF type:complete len:162 (-),score=14.32 GHVU01218103.1:1079-1564(-)